MRNKTEEDRRPPQLKSSKHNSGTCRCCCLSVFYKTSFGKEHITHKKYASKKKFKKLLHITILRLMHHCATTAITTMDFRGFFRFSQSFTTLSPRNGRELG